MGKDPALLDPLLSGTAANLWAAEVWSHTAIAVITLALTALAVRLVRGWLTRVLRRAHSDPSTVILVRRTAAILIAVFGVLAALGTLGVSPATLVALTGAVGLALSLAAQDILKSFFSGVYLLLERPFRVGDVVAVKDQQGRVENIGVRMTTLRRDDNVQVMVPNAVMFAEVVTNHTHERVAPPEQRAEASPATGPTSDGHTR